MTVTVQKYDLGADAEFHIDPELGVRLAKQPVNDKSLLLLNPYGNDEPRFRRYLVGIIALTRATTRSHNSSVETVQGRGQIVLTGRRVLGLVTEGTHDDATLSEALGTVTGFSIARRDILAMHIPTNWRGKPKRVMLGISSTGSKPMDISLDLQVMPLVVVGEKTLYSSVEAFVKALDDEAAQELLSEPG